MSERAMLVRETAISIVINMMFSVLFFWLVFGTPASVPLVGAHGLGPDFLPQSFMVALMGSLVPTLILRKKRGLQHPSVARIARQAIVTALASAVLAGGGAWSLAAASGVEQLAGSSAILIKLAFAAILSATVTPIALVRLLRGSDHSGSPT